MEIKTGFENLDFNLAQDLKQFLTDSIKALTTHDKKDIIKMLQDGYKIADHFEGFDEHIDNMILNVAIPTFVESFLPKVNE